jgi:hypothetical protein
MRRLCTESSRLRAVALWRASTSLSGEICLPCGRRLMSRFRKGFNGKTKNPACSLAVDGYESLREPQNKQRLMSDPAAPWVATSWVSQQKSAEGIVPGGCRRGRPERRKEGASDKLDIGDESERMSRMSARYGSAFPRSHPGRKSCIRRGCGFNVRLRPDDFCEPPIGDPHDGWCGEGRLITVPYPIKPVFWPFCY